MATHREGNPQEMLDNPGGIAKYSTFPLGKKHATTEIFGIITPFEFRDVITGDEHQIGSEETVDTYTLTAPLMSVVWKTREWYMVPRMAILPNAWDKIYTQPVIGDDIDATVAGTSVDQNTWTTFLKEVVKLITTNLTTLKSTTAETGGTAKTIIETFEALLKGMIVNEYIFSYGSLLNRAGIKMAALWSSESGKTKNFDQAFDLFIQSISYGFRVTWDDETPYSVRTGLTADLLTNELSIREFLTKARDNLNFTVTGIWLFDVAGGIIGKTDTLTNDTATAVNAEKGEWVTALDKNAYPYYGIEYGKPVDIARLWAYQLICAETYSDDQIDYIYNSDIYRQYIGDLVKDMIYTAEDHLEDFGYTLNGIWTAYDWLSAAGFAYAASNMSNGYDIPYDYMTALFNLNRSLKYKDYYTGARTTPILPGQNTVAVNDGKFEILDVANASQAAKFKFAVKRIGRKISEYVKGLLGINMAIDYHYPLWIGSTKTILHAIETDNTGAAMYDKDIPKAVTSNLVGKSGNYRFVGTFDRYGIIVGVSFYDVERMYYRGVDRNTMKVDRFDHFNQYMQFAGDQPLYSEEYDAALTVSAGTYFGYKPAYEELKEPINTADAGFVTALPGYAFLNDMEKNGGNAPGARANEHVSPDFIRSKPTELDRFYKSLSGYSLSNYFHFIIIYSQGDDAKRPIVYNPGLAL